MNTSKRPSYSMRGLVLALTCASALAVSAMAQEPPQATPPPPHHEGRGGAAMEERHLEHMTKALSLTPDQVTQIKAIQDSGRQQMMAMREDNSTPGPDRHAKMQAFHEAQEAKIKGVLNDEQKGKYDAMQEMNKERHEGHRDGGPPSPPPPPPAN